MQIAVKVETGFNCNWRNIEPLQPEGFKGQTANEKETLKNSIVKNGFHDAFDVWKHDNKLLSIDGVHRKIALLELAAEGYEIPEQMPCTYVTAENETEAATIILSRNSQHSHIIRAAVLMEACAIPAKMIEAVVPQKNLEAWSESDNSITEQLTAEEDDFEFEDGGIETDIVIGDLFEIGEHRLLCGDSTDSDKVAKLMNGEKADLGLTDPPYNLGYDYATYDDNLTSEEYNDFIIGYVSNLISFSEKQIITSGKQNVGYYYKNFDITEFAVWYAKNKMSGSKIANLGLCEPILFIGKFNRNARATDMFEFTVKQQKETGGHTCPKVMEFFSDLLNSYSDRLILDLFLGSGTTMVAAHQLKRKCYGMELDPKYCQVIIDRMRKLDPTLIIKRNGVIYE